MEVRAVAACLAFDVFSLRLTQVSAFHRLALLRLNVAFLARLSVGPPADLSRGISLVVFFRSGFQLPKCVLYL